MKKLANLNGVKSLNKKEQRSINGGGGSCGDKICLPICGYTGGIYLYTGPHGVCCGCC